MPVDFRLFEVLVQLRDWAETKATIRRLWIYGSRLRGTQCDDSDLDVAIEVDALETLDQRISFGATRTQWEKELAALTPKWTVQIEMHGTPKVDQFVACCGMLVYVKRGAPPVRAFDW